MVPPVAGLGPATDVVAERQWLTPERLTRVRAILLALSLFLGLAVYVFHTLGASHLAQPILVRKLRGVGMLTWIYALVQLIDLRFYNSRWAQRRRASIGIPDSLHGWLFGQMLACLAELDIRPALQRQLEVHARRRKIHQRAAVIEA